MHSVLNGKICVFLGVVSTSSMVAADHIPPLQPFSEIQIKKQQTPDTHQHCEESSYEEPTEPLCETNSTETTAFTTEPILNFSTQIDIRPENCQSFFDDYLHTRRGLRIESALHTTAQFNRLKKTVSTFPVIDFIEGRTAHVSKSRDLSTKIYNGELPDKSIYTSIISDAMDIEERIFNALSDNQTISATVQGRTTTLNHGEVSNLILHIVIQSGIATPAQIKQIQLAKEELATRWGYELRIIEIP